MECLNKGAHESHNRITAALNRAAGPPDGRAKRDGLEINGGGKNDGTGFLRGQEGQSADDPGLDLSSHQSRGDLRVAAELDDRHIFVGFEAGFVDGDARKGVGFGAVLRYAHDPALQILKPANAGFSAYQKLLRRDV